MDVFSKRGWTGNKTLFCTKVRAMSLNLSSLDVWVQTLVNEKTTLILYECHCVQSETKTWRIALSQGYCCGGHTYKDKRPISSNKNSLNMLTIVDVVVVVCSRVFKQSPQQYTVVDFLFSIHRKLWRWRDSHFTSAWIISDFILLD